MNPTVRILLAVTALAMGALIAYAYWIRLGWRRHGRDAWDWSFLHLDWVFRPELPYWDAHMHNLAGLVLGLVLVVVGVFMGFGTLKAVAWSKPRPVNLGPHVATFDQAVDE